MEPPDHTDLPASQAADDDSAAPGSRAARLQHQRTGWRRRSLLVTLIVLVVVGAGVGAYAFVSSNDTSSAGTSGGNAAAAAPATTVAPSTTTTIPPTTTTTIPKTKQPKDVKMPSPGASGIGWGSRGPLVLLYESRLKALHFDPGPVDGVFDQDTEYAVTALEKYVGLQRDGHIGPQVQMALSHFRYVPSVAKGDGDRVEIDLDKQTLTLFKNYQVESISTTSTASGEHFCGGVDGCQYAITPTGHYHFYELHRGWQKGKLGTMWNPYYFNGGIAVHGLASVPPYPASHGCARIPMHIADYFYTLVHNGESVYVVGTPKQAGSGYVGPVHEAPTTSTTAKSPDTIKKAGHGKTTTPPTTATHPKTTTTKPKTTTTKP